MYQGYQEIECFHCHSILGYKHSNGAPESLAFCQDCVEAEIEAEESEKDEND